MKNFINRKQKPKIKLSRSDKKRKKNTDEKKATVEKKDSQKVDFGNPERAFRETVLKPNLSIKENFYHELKELKIIVKNNGNKKGNITLNPLLNGYFISLKKGNITNILITKRGEIRYFKTIDSAFKTLNELGIKTANLSG